MDMDKRSSVAIKVTAVGMVVNILLTVFKLVVGYLFKSMALVADGVHSLSDLLSDIFIIITFKISKKPADEGHNYGHGRAEVISEILVSVMLIAVAIKMLKNGAIAIKNISSNPITAPSMLVLLVAALSIVSKEALYWYTMHYAKKVNSNSMKVNAVHHRSDAISSIAVLVALGFAKIFGSAWYILDPIIALVVAVYILIVALKILFEGCNTLMDASVSKGEIEKIMNILNNIPDTSDPHHVRTRKIGSYIAIELHIRVNPDMKIRKAHIIATEIENKLKQEFGPDTFVSVHIEPEKVNGEYK